MTAGLLWRITRELLAAFAVGAFVGAMITLAAYVAPTFQRFA